MKRVRARALEDEIGIIIVRHLGSKNPDYPDNSYECGKFVALAKDLAYFVRLAQVRTIMKPCR